VVVRISTRHHALRAPPRPSEAQSVPPGIITRCPSALRGRSHPHNRSLNTPATDPRR
jgi:hypothetical protein